MDPDASFSASCLFKWDPPRPVLTTDPVAPPPAAAYAVRPREVGGGGGGGLEELFEAYGIRYYTAAKLGELGFTANTLLGMRDEELDQMMDSLSHIFRWDLLVGERYGIKAAVRAERRRLLSAGDHSLDALSQQGFLEEAAVQQEMEAAGSGGGGVWGMVAAGGKKLRLRKNNYRRRSSSSSGNTVWMDDVDDDDEGEEEDDQNGGGNERQREHPFIVTEPGEVARGKKNGLDYLFYLYEQCREFLIQVQKIAKERGEKCPTKVTNQVFRYAKAAGANYINKPKMRHYVHCYALHCLDEAASNALRRSFKERRENVGAWRQACYNPVVVVAAAYGWDIDAVFNSHPRLSIWYVPTKLRQLCHVERSNAAAAAASSSVTGGGPDHLSF
ncbi:hypothetical protein ABFX02_04G116600 [Erythranthe guttata]